MQAVTGRIHSIETCGMVDGPGLRFVVFLQGCPLRCRYCHNPDTWNCDGGKITSSEEIVNEALKYKTWMETSGGGITLSGGEPLFQPEFAENIIDRAHKKGISVALDTSGFGNLSKTSNCLDKADLIILDIKTALPDEYKKLTGVSSEKTLTTLEYLKKIKKPLWIRHVLVPGLTDDIAQLTALKNLLLDIPTLEKFEFLPFHKMGEQKWEQLEYNYTLTNTKPPKPDFVSKITKDFSLAGIPVNGS
ncbi:MAG: pyruvate formate-lyase-activating protein [Spirochaetales bacterium]|nr:pyruvate formate-lyase-activating protein [Spirochaetales bacterium]